MTADSPRVEQPSTRPLFLPLAAALLLASFGWLPHVRSNAALAASVTGASVMLMAWWLLLWFRGRAVKFEVALRPSHYMQTITQLSIFIYWGIYWPPMREAAALIAAQVVFAFAFDMLLSWTRRDTHTLGFGPIPIVFSINLFLRFHDDWFYLQFVIIAVGFLAKELIRWNKNGRRVHIFNPSSFPLALASLVLIATNTAHLTWGEDLALQLFLPPQIFFFLFLVSLPGQFRFGVTTMSLAAIVTTYGFGMAYLAATGTYFFIDDYIPIAAFLGMLLLFTDPSTAPATELGRILYGVIYGVCVVGLYALLDRMGLPTFYDKLLQVPLMNLSVQAIDRAARSKTLAWMDPARIGRGLPPMRRHLVYTSVWVVVFSAMAYAGGLGDHHPGHSVRFWQRACEDGRSRGCEILGRIEVRYCAQGSGWACNEAGILMSEGRLPNNTHAAEAFTRACDLGFAAGCENGRRQAADPLHHGAPTTQDYALLLREGKGALPETTPQQLLTLACQQGWTTACEDLAGGQSRSGAESNDRTRAIALLQQICNSGDGGSCSSLGFMYSRGEGVSRDEVKARALLKRACDLGAADACRWLATQGR